MAIDTRQKRMSATHLSCPWRGPLVDATEAGFSADNRAAALYLYSGFGGGGGGPAPAEIIWKPVWVPRRRE